MLREERENQSESERKRKREKEREVEVARGVWRRLTDMELYPWWRSTTSLKQLLFPLNH